MVQASAIHITGRKTSKDGVHSHESLYSNFGGKSQENAMELIRYCISDAYVVCAQRLYGSHDLQGGGKHGPSSSAHNSAQISSGFVVFCCYK